MSPQNLTHNPHNSELPSQFGNCEYCEDDSRRVKKLIAELRALGVVLSIDGGQLSFDAPAGVMTDELLARLRADRDAVLKRLDPLGDLINEKKHCKTEVIQSILDPVPESDEMPPGIHCPFCQCRRLDDEPRGMRCKSCGRLAWLFLANGSAVRADCAKLDLRFDV